MARRETPKGILRLPLFLLIWGIAALAMWLPASHALIRDDHATSRAFSIPALSD